MNLADIESVIKKLKEVKDPKATERQKLMHDISELKNKKLNIVIDGKIFDDVTQILGCKKFGLQKYKCLKEKLSLLINALEPLLIQESTKSTKPKKSGILLNLKEEDYNKVYIPIIDNDNIQQEIHMVSTKSIEEDILSDYKFVEKASINNTELELQEELIQDDENINVNIHEYNRFTKKNPMHGISWNEKLQTWDIRCNDLDIKTRNKKLNIGCDLIIKKIIDSSKLQFLQNSTVNSKIRIKGKNILLFNSVKEPLFDLLHILSFLDLSKDCYYRKYNDSKKYITHFTFTKNKFGGYILRHLVDEKAIFKIIVKGDSAFANSFIEDYADIMKNLRKMGLLTIKNDKLQLDKSAIHKVNNVPHYDKKAINDDKIEKKLTCYQQNNNTIQRYDNYKLYPFVQSLIRNGSKIILQHYMNTSVMYMCIVSILDPDGLNRIFAKVGYSSNFNQRFKDLQNEYGCGFFLIGLKTVHNEAKEKQFHDSIRQFKKHLVFPIKINNKTKDEIYILDESLYNEFMSIKEYSTNNYGVVDSELQNHVNEQTIHFNRFLNEMSLSLILHNMHTLNDEKCHEFTNCFSLMVKSMELEYKHKEKIYEADKQEKREIREFELKKLQMEHERELYKLKHIELYNNINNEVMRLTSKKNII